MPASLAPIDAYTFVDVGAGMGRAMLLASAYPFRAVVGVELHPTLARIGRRNLASWRAAGRALAPMRMHCRDAADFPLPPGPCVAFLFNPFGAPVLRRLLRAWSRDPCRTRRATGYSVRKQRAGERVGARAGICAAFSRPGPAVARRCRGRPHNSQAAAGRRVRGHGLGGLLDLSLGGKNRE